SASEKQQDSETDFELPPTIRIWKQDQLFKKMEERVMLSLAPWKDSNVSLEDIRSNARHNPELVLAAIIDQRLYVDATSTGLHASYDKLSGWYDQLVNVLRWWEERGIRIP